MERLSSQPQCLKLEREPLIDWVSMSRRNKRRDNVFFYGGLAVSLILLYGGAAFLHSVNPNQGRPFEEATNIASALVIGAFVERKVDIGWGVLVGVTICALAEIGSRKFTREGRWSFFENPSLAPSLRYLTL